MTSDRSLREKINEYRANIQPDHRYASFDYCYPKAKLIDMYGFMKGGARPTG